MPFIIIMTIIIYLILISWVWQNLGQIDKSKKIIFSLLGIGIVYIITLIIFSISKSNINYQNIESQNIIKTMLVTIFTGLNGIIVIPIIARIIEKTYEGEIERKQTLKRVIPVLVVFLIVLIFECGYLKDIQEGILKVYQSLGK